MKVGYARVSSVGQKLEAQLEQLKASGVDKVFSEKESGAKSNREQLKACIEYVREKDVLVVTKLDRLARSMVDFWNIVNEIESKGASLQILNMGLDTSTPNGKLVMGVLSSVAEWERSMIRERQQDGLERAKREGVVLGRPNKVDAVRNDVQRLLDNGLTKQAIADELGIGVATVYRALKVA